MLPLLCILTCVSAVLYIQAEYAGTFRQIFFFKPATTLLIVLLCAVQVSEISRSYSVFVLTGLMFSLGGDVFLMLPSDRFFHGLLSFLCAHILYIFAFSSEFGFQIHLTYLLPMLVLGGILLKILLSHTGKMAVPVIVYTTIIITMLWQALERWGMARHSSSTLAAIGALLFVFSDVTLAYNRFVRSFKPARLLTLSTYYLAQCCIAISV